MQIDSYNSLDAQSLLLVREQRTAGSRPSRRELITNGVGAVGFIGAAGLLAVLSDWAQPFRLVNAVLVLAVWLMVERIRFPVASCWTYPTMLVFVPALFMLPTEHGPIAIKISYYRYGTDTHVGKVEIAYRWADIEALSQTVDALPAPVTALLSSRSQ